MVEGQARRQAGFRENPRFPGVVAGDGTAFGPGDINRGDRVKPGVAPRIRVGVKLADKVDGQRSLLVGFADRRFLQGFAGIDESPGKSPAVGRVLPLDEYDSGFAAVAHDLDDDVDGRKRISGLSHPLVKDTGTPPACQNRVDFIFLIVLRTLSLSIFLVQKNQS